MSFFDDEDDLDAIVREFFGSAKRRERVIRGEDDERIMDFVEVGNKIFLIFEIPGYSDNDVIVKVGGNNLKITAQRKDSAKEYLLKKLSKGIRYERVLPNFIDPRKFDYTFRNGILEISFDKSDSND